MTTADLYKAHDRAVADGARRAFTKRAVALRAEADGMSTTIQDKQGRAVPLVPPEAVVKRRTAALLDECAAVIEQGA